MDRLAMILSTLGHLDLEGDIERKESVQSEFGGSCDVFMAWSKKRNAKVAVKRIRVFLRKDEKFAKRLAKEIRIWASLDHECVLPLLGYFVEGNDAMPSLVSLWMTNGTLDDFMNGYPRGGEDTRAMLGWIACGLSYLHSQQVIHADLKSKNILVSPDHKPQLADFGISKALSFTKTGSTTNMASGTVRWMAIELFEDEPSEHTPATDVWAFGMVAYEILSGSIPYSDKADPRVPLLIIEGKVPSKPENKHQFSMFDPMWEICVVCWNKAPEKRPIAAQLYEDFSAMAPVHATDPDDDEAFDDVNTQFGNSSSMPSPCPPSPPRASSNFSAELVTPLARSDDNLTEREQRITSTERNSRNSILAAREQRRIAREMQDARFVKQVKTPALSSDVPSSSGSPNAPELRRSTFAGMSMPLEKTTPSIRNRKIDVLGDRERRRLAREAQRDVVDFSRMGASAGTPLSSTTTANPTRMIPNKQLGSGQGPDAGMTPIELGGENQARNNVLSERELRRLARLEQINKERTIKQGVTTSPSSSSPNASRKFWTFAELGQSLEKTSS